MENAETGTSEKLKLGKQKAEIGRRKGEGKAKG
jgi:hypothetical protein